jgi:hypothetical protein
MQLQSSPCRSGILFQLRLLLFCLSSVVVLSTAPAAIKPLRLDEILAIRFIRDAAGALVTQAGLLDSQASFRVFETQLVATGVDVPTDVIGRWLIIGSTWFAYDALGSEALANFVIGSPLIFIGEQNYFPVSVAEHPSPVSGDMINLSTRAFLVPGNDPVIAGFVVSGGSRRILLRAIGPGLTPYGVAAPLADPFITLFASGSSQPILSNDDWTRSSDATAIEQAAIATGAFPLARGSKDAASLVELDAGVYTVQVTTPGATGGTLLVEVYAVP